MSKGNKRRGNREQKKPMQEKPKTPASANSGIGKSSVTMAGKKV